MWNQACDWSIWISISLSDYKLSDYRFPDQLVWNTEVYGPIKLEEIVIFMINSVTMKVLLSLPRINNNCLAYSNYSYSRIGPQKCALNRSFNLHVSGVSDMDDKLDLFSFGAVLQQIHTRLIVQASQNCPLAQNMATIGIF